MGYKKLSVKASKAADAAKNKKVQAMKKHRLEARAVSRAKNLQRSGSMQGKQASKTRSGYRMK